MLEKRMIRLFIFITLESENHNILLLHTVLRYISESKSIKG